MTDDRPRLQLLVGQEKFQYRLYLGYAGWEPSQLEYEIDGGNWLVLKANSAHIFSSVETLWQKVFQQIGHKFVRETLQIKHIPKDVRLN